MGVHFVGRLSLLTIWRRPGQIRRGGRFQPRPPPRASRSNETLHSLEGEGPAKAAVAPKKQRVFRSGVRQGVSAARPPARLAHCCLERQKRDAMEPRDRPDFFCGDRSPTRCSSSSCAHEQRSLKCPPLIDVLEWRPVNC